MTTRPMPYDPAAEREVVGFMLASWSAHEIADELTAEDFYELRWRQAFEAWEPEISPFALAAKIDVPVGELLAASADGLGQSLANVKATAGLLVTLTFRRRAIAQGLALAAAGGEGDDDEVHRLLEGASELTGPTLAGTPSPTAAEFMDRSDDPYDWVIPGVLEVGDRLLVTAGEGAGKSTLLRQMAAQAASGVHPWSLRRMPSQRALIIDLENPERKIRRDLRDITSRVHVDLSELRVESHPQGIDVTTRAGASWLAGKVKANRPRLVVVGPLYKMYAGNVQKGDTGGENQARQIVSVLDRIRTTYNCALLMETHAPHAGIQGRDLRPFGSSVWLRWPDFGLGLSREEPDDDVRWAVKHWRGPRDRRLWPTHLVRDHNGWPWKAQGPGIGTAGEDA